MFYRRYFAICLFSGMLLILLVTRRRTQAPLFDPGSDQIPVSEHLHADKRISWEFEWAPRNANATSMEVTLRPTKRRRGVVASDVVARQQSLIAEELGDNTFPERQRPHFTDYVPAKGHGGRPLMNLIVGTWESYLPTVGDILNSVPGNYYFLEPLARLGIVQLNATDSTSGLQELKDLMSCRYSQAPLYIEDTRGNVGMVMKNRRLWSQCRTRRELCFNPEFLRAFCQQFPIKTMAVVRLRLSAVAEWLADKNVDIRVVFLVRDPRALVQARQSKKWCKNIADCASPERICQLMAEDWVAYKNLSALYPGRITLLRFEDLALNPLAVTQRMLQFLKLPFTSQTREMLETRIEETGNPRKLKIPAFLWKDRISWEMVENVQEKCWDVTTELGYRMLNSTTHSVSSFVPMNGVPGMPSNTEFLVDLADAEEVENPKLDVSAVSGIVIESLSVKRQAAQSISSSGASPTILPDTNLKDVLINGLARSPAEGQDLDEDKVKHLNKKNSSYLVANQTSLREGKLPIAIGV